MKTRLAALALLVLAVITQAAPSAATQPDATDAILAKMPLFSKDDPWHKDISKEPIDPNSDALIASIGIAKSLHPDFGAHFGIPFQFVDKTTKTYKPTFQYADDSDKVAYPIPDHPLIEGGADAPQDSDRHILCIDIDTWKLYEMWHCFPKNNTWDCGSGCVFDLTKSSVGQRPKGLTSADAAGLPIFPGLVRYDEAAIKKVIDHAVRFTIVKSQHAYVAPATHYASSKTDKSLPPMGMRVRLKASVDISTYPDEDKALLAALKKYGMIVADNGGNWYISGAPDPRWNDDNLQTLRKVKGTDFDVIKMENVVTK
jgi:hypothetical protein